MEDQHGSRGLVLNADVLWTTWYIDAPGPRPTATRTPTPKPSTPSSTPAPTPSDSPDGM